MLDYATVPYRTVRYGTLQMAMMTSSQRVHTYEIFLQLFFFTRTVRYGNKKIKIMSLCIRTYVEIRRTISIVQAGNSVFRGTTPYVRKLIYENFR